jgi:prevent-host-death family protein
MKLTHLTTTAVDLPLYDWYTGHMGRIMTATEVKAKILALLDEVASGDEVEITKHGHVVARLVPASGAQSLRGKLAGVAMTASAEEDLYTTGARWNLP